MPIKSNILIDDAGDARLADFGLLKITSDPANNLSSSSNFEGGTRRWMSPELMNPEKFGLRKESSTKPSDCYAFGMVIYEILGGNPPFYEHKSPAVMLKIAEGKHPSRGAVFTDSLWDMLECCWKFQPSDRLSIKDILHHLESAPRLPQPPFESGVGEGGRDSDESNSRDKSRMLSRIAENDFNSVRQL